MTLKASKTQSDPAIPWERIHEDVNPDSEVVGQKPFLVPLEERNVFHHYVDEHEGQGKNRGGGGFHVEAREHEGEGKHHTGIHRQKNVRDQVGRQAE